MIARPMRARLRSAFRSTGGAATGAAGGACPPVCAMAQLWHSYRSRRVCSADWPRRPRTSSARKSSTAVAGSATSAATTSSGLTNDIVARFHAGGERARVAVGVVAAAGPERRVVAGLTGGPRVALIAVVGDLRLALPRRRVDVELQRALRSALCRAGCRRRRSWVVRTADADTDVRAIAIRSVIRTANANSESEIRRDVPVIGGCRQAPEKSGADGRNEQRTHDGPLNS